MRFYFFLLLVLLSNPLAAQTLQDRVPSKIFTDQDNRFLTLTVENDLFGAGTDQNYTSGVRLTYFDVGGRSPFLARTLDQYIPTFEVNETTSVYYSIGQNLYTPDDINRATPDPNDRPYAAFLYGSAGFASITDDHLDNIELSLGMIGPAALGEFTQESVHHLINADDPKGWDHELKNEPGLILSWERRWPEAIALDDLRFFYTRLSPHAGMTLGNIYSYANTGLTLQLVPKQYKWQTQPPRVRPAIPGSGFFAVPEDKWAWSLFAGADARMIGRNIFLDGNTFTGSPLVDKNYFVTDLNAGLSLTYGRTQMSYTLNWRSKEFKDQDEGDLFGSINIGYRF